jgi:hypothetical protein
MTQNQRSRITVDVNDMKAEIESCRSDPAWQELPLSSKIRVLLKERLNQIKENVQQESE